MLRGYNPASLCTLANLVEYAAFKTGLEFFLERSGGGVVLYDRFRRGAFADRPLLGKGAVADLRQAEAAGRLVAVQS